MKRRLAVWVPLLGILLVAFRQQALPQKSEVQPDSGARNVGANAFAARLPCVVVDVPTTDAPALPTSWPILRTNSRTLFAVPLDESGLRGLTERGARTTSLSRLRAPTVVDAQLAPAAKTDLNARETNGVARLVQANKTLDGRGVTISVVDVGRVWAEHSQFLTVPGDVSSSRVKAFTTSALHDHATHVAGTIGSAGTGEMADTKGMAPAVQLASYAVDDCSSPSWAKSAFVSNHSTVDPAGWEVDDQLVWWGPDVENQAEDPRFGAYDLLPLTMDTVTFQNPHHLAVAAAGNDQTHSVVPGSKHDHGFLGPRVDTHRNDSRKNGFDTVNSWCVAKNALCVGAIQDRLVAGAGIVLNAASSWGPTDDGRLKPEVVANGQTVISTIGQSSTTESFDSQSGTSSATAVTSGIAALVVQQMIALKIAPSGALLKAVLVHTATDRLPAGPDAAYGFGSVDAEAAVDVLSSGVIRTEQVRQGQPVEMRFNSNGARAPRVTVAWTDAPGTPRWDPVVKNQIALDDPTPMLVNDIDIELFAGQSLEPERPWVLDPKDPMRAVQARNAVDNLEVIDAPAASGEWRLRITAAKLGAGQVQPVAVVVSGLGACTNCAP